MLKTCSKVFARRGDFTNLMKLYKVAHSLLPEHGMLRNGNAMQYCADCHGLLDSAEHIP